MFRQGRIEIEGIEVILSKSYYLVKRKLCFYLLQFMPGLEMIMLLPCVLHGRQQASCIGLGTHQRSTSVHSGPQRACWLFRKYDNPLSKSCVYFQEDGLIELIYQFINSGNNASVCMCVLKPIFFPMRFFLFCCFTDPFCYSMFSLHCKNYIFHVTELYDFLLLFCLFTCQ